jgi:integrase
VDRAAEATLRPKTIDRYSTDLRLHVLPKFGRRKLSSLDVEDVAGLLADLRARRLAGWTQRGVLVALGRVVGTAARRGLIPENPIAKLERGERPKVQRREFPSLDRGAVAGLIAATPDRYRPLVAVSVLTGIRQGEALGLRWQDVDTREGVLRVRWAHRLARKAESASAISVPSPSALQGDVRTEVATRTATTAGATVIGPLEALVSNSKMR